MKARLSTPVFRRLLGHQVEMSQTSPGVRGPAEATKKLC